MNMNNSNSRYQTLSMPRTSRKCLITKSNITFEDYLVYFQILNYILYRLWAAVTWRLCSHSWGSQTLSIRLPTRQWDYFPLARVVVWLRITFCLLLPTASCKHKCYTLVKMAGKEATRLPHGFSNFRWCESNGSAQTLGVWGRYRWFHEGPVWSTHLDNGDILRVAECMAFVNCIWGFINNFWIGDIVYHKLRVSRSGKRYRLLL